MRGIEARDAIRDAAHAYEEALPPKQRKQLGQHFTGLPLGKLLAHLALDSDTATVLDPMAGHGDLLDATLEAANERRIGLRRLDGIEIDETTAAMCRNRLHEILGNDELPEQRTIAADAFDLTSVEALPLRIYDLVITNPPYVRYQARDDNDSKAESIRTRIVAIINNRLSLTDRVVWKELAEAYSGLADLSVPAWLLAASMVRPGGRLAIVAPATWRSRDYADVIRYLLLRCFWLEYIVEDKQPGWFSSALVRTHLIVARRLSEDEIARPLGDRVKFPDAIWLEVAPEASAGRSLVGAAFKGDHSEGQFAEWSRNACRNPLCGINARTFNVHDEWIALESRIGRRRWYRRLEGRVDNLRLSGSSRLATSISIPDTLKRVLPSGFVSGKLVTLEAMGIQVGQGLRTGCNKFFYVTADGSSDRDMVRVEASSLFGNQKFSVPADTLRPVLRRQSELRLFDSGHRTDGRVLDLRGWVLPEDLQTVTDAKEAYAGCGESLPKVMPDELADYVRGAAVTPPTIDNVAIRIPNLSAVRTNIRIARDDQVTPRFWYMLPAFARRHLPAVFVARINHGLPWVEANLDPPFLIDANFATIWSQRGHWTRYGLKALLNSIWCRAFMEALGTSFGGGALKLEATHLRQMAVPVLRDAEREALAEAGRHLTKSSFENQARIDAIVLEAVLRETTSVSTPAQLTKALEDGAQSMSYARQRVSCQAL